MSTPAGALNYTHLSANGTTTIKSGGGLLHTITINAPGPGGNTLTVYDNTAGSGTVIAALSTNVGYPVTLLYDLQFTTGLTVVLATGQAADVTITWQ
jgi:hypothetical protein